MWTANLFQITTGDIGPQLNFEDLSWSISLNETEDFSVTLRKSDLPKVDYNYWLAPWWAGVVIFWDGKPIVAGPITDRPSEGFKTVSLSCAGIRQIFARRYVVTEMTDWSTLAKTTIQYKGMSLGTVAKRVTAHVLNKVGGSLPISYAVPDELVADDANHRRTYQGFNIQNISVDDIFTKLSNVRNGPDIMFKPRLVADNKLTFDLWTGTEHQPRITQKRVPIWDTVPVLGGISDAQVTVSGGQQTSRVFALGAGLDQGQMIRVNTNSTPLSKGFPLLESTVNPGNNENKTIVDNFGKAKLAHNASVKQQMQISVRADDAVNFLGSYWPGDLIKLNIKGWISLPDGITDFRLLNMNGDNSNQIRLSLQPESQFNAEKIDIIEEE